MASYIKKVLNLPKMEKETSKRSYSEAFGDDEKSPISILMEYSIQAIQAIFIFIIISIKNLYNRNKSKNTRQKNSHIINGLITQRHARVKKDSVVQ